MGGFYRLTAKHVQDQQPQGFSDFPNQTFNEFMHFFYRFSIGLKWIITSVCLFGDFIVFYWQLLLIFHIVLVLRLMKED